MGFGSKSSIPHLFTNKEERMRIQKWDDTLKADPGRYANCFVVNFTRVKNLDSKWKHEYTQFIVEDSETGDRARVYAERLNDKELQDCVTVGRTELGFSEWSSLPLPLQTIIFDQAHRPKLIQISTILRKTSDQAGPYNLFGEQCFWFAKTVYDVIKLSFGSITEKEWPWLNPGGDEGNTLRGFYGLALSTFFKFTFTNTATEFKANTERHMDYLQSNDARQVVTPEQMTNGIVDAFKEKSVMDEYLEAMKMNGINVDDAEVEKVAASVQKSAAEKSKTQEINWTEEFHEEVTHFTDNVLKDTEKNDLLKFYDEKEKENAPVDEEGNKIITLRKLYYGPGSDRYWDMEQAMKVLAARVVKDIECEAGKV